MKCFLQIQINRVMHCPLFHFPLQNNVSLPIHAFIGTQKRQTASFPFTAAFLVVFPTFTAAFLVVFPTFTAAFFADFKNFFPFESFFCFGASTTSTSSPAGCSSISTDSGASLDSISNRHKAATKTKAIKESRDILAY
ncbi:hypothetical protein T07_2589 [Trichinella nelsoni]|uniref:Uncharacterized protein n=1 Tax=Trichinella nelsoni TaxID=6336 RepID=A0A0V0SEI6_9BILA|nr:hypothetical protein T07_2589 [Trichinella nelsoni]